MDGACSGYRVVDFTTMVSGPICTQVLGDLGAEVIKVEAPQGDPMRVLGGAVRDGTSGIFVQLNRNKRGVVLDLGQEQGREAARRLVDGADVVVENFRPGVAERLGIGYETLRERVPELIYCGISGFGPDGPYASLPAYDHIVQGLTAMMPVHADAGGPRMIQSVIVDKTTGLAAASAIVTALLARERTGRGQRVDVNMLDAFAACMLPELVGGVAFPDVPSSPTSSAQMYRAWKTLDGHVVGIVIQDSQFRGFCKMVEREDLLEDPRFGTLQKRWENTDAFYALIEREFEKWPTRTLVERAQRFGAPFGPVNDFQAFLDDPQTRHNGTVFEVTDERGLCTRQLAHAARYAATPASVRRYPPDLGEHTDEVLGEAGLGADEIERLREAGICR